MVVTTDVHYFAPSLTDNGKAFEKYVAAGDGKQLAYSDEITDAFLADVEAKKTDVLIISGDLTNNGEKTSHEELAKKLTQVEKTGTQVLLFRVIMTLTTLGPANLKKISSYQPTLYHQLISVKFMVILDIKMLFQVMSFR